MTREEAIKVLRTESIELGGNAVSVCRFLEALDMAVKALEDAHGKDAEKNEPLTLDDAIAHLDDTLSDTERKWSCESCRMEHVQLRAWLAELRDIKQERNIPLTLEELREMVGKWIWWDVDYGGYCRCENGYVVSKSGTYSFEWVSTHGKAYRQNPKEDAYVRT